MEWRSEVNKIKNFEKERIPFLNAFLPVWPLSGEILSLAKFQKYLAIFAS